MKRLLPLLLLLFVFGCDDDNFNNNNPNIPSYNFSVDLNLSLPGYNSLNYPGNGIYLGGYGARGIFVFYTGSGYVAYDAACPNQPITACSTMQLQGIVAVCPCDDVEYNIYTGQASGQRYPMKPYRVQTGPGYVRVYN
ncbi:hypothetical protein [Flavobacterium sp.]|uniref:Rieske (2Fe-2S) protein n=1 Tax=Flavobacterium sp. TaxID=239 RepID=UPI0011F45FB2|nr:hypothetical protein [Flavobacterium sp.]RZJ73878.1 MAG: hypothetical protein EOO49_00545 [Flavobacterium sp.]